MQVRSRFLDQSFLKPIRKKNESKLKYENEFDYIARGKNTSTNILTR